jgi:hypothetical protein
MTLWGRLQWVVIIMALLALFSIASNVVAACARLVT